MLLLREEYVPNLADFLGREVLDHFHFDKGGNVFLGALNRGCMPQSPSRSCGSSSWLHDQARRFIKLFLVLLKKRVCLCRREVAANGSADESLKHFRSGKKDGRTKGFQMSTRITRWCPMLGRLRCSKVVELSKSIILKPSNCLKSSMRES